MERRLTTILAADVVGYSRLMGADEAGTLAVLKGHRVELFDPNFRKRYLCCAIIPVKRLVVTVAMKKRPPRWRRQPERTP